MTKVAVILSGCGVFDGAEICESVLTLWALEQEGAEYQCFAPNIEQAHVINHLNGEEMSEKRNVLVESARIARGNVKDLKEFAANEFDALILPGGFGAAKNLSNFAFKGADCDVNSDVLQACKAMAESKKPCGYICISPAIIPKVYGEGAKLTIGNDKDTAENIEKMGGEHVNCSVDKFVVDEELRVVSTPAYMLAGNITEAASGITKLVHHVVGMIER
ncbi:isoprenoid biosynthesis glyoxalase ElbB [Pleionea sediminis]|uniref:isoprenoid biosynthesis glyoxalase ElbB n=1 Tax=Pleionea sediminis TaxID=2569479 RepID=UPI0011858731|nr:isoprenoid biosynthesis glyoxalase ElbB [Pleionea sediminis]